MGRFVEMAFDVFGESGLQFETLMTSLDMTLEWQTNRVFVCHMFVERELECTAILTIRSIADKPLLIDVKLLMNFERELSLKLLIAVIDIADNRLIQHFVFLLYVNTHITLSSKFLVANITFEWRLSGVSPLMVSKTTTFVSLVITSGK